MSDSLLRVSGLKKYFPVHAGLFRSITGYVKALDGVDFDMAAGEVLGIVGESGSGKSTLGRTVLRLSLPTEGTVLFEGKDPSTLDVKQLKTFRKDAQIIFQDPLASLNPRKTIRQSLGEGMKFHGLVSSPSEEKERIAQILEQVGLESDTMTRYPHQFSGGQQQRICIGRAIALNPKMIVCDEALSALDVSVQAQVLNLLMELKNHLSLSYLFISHDLSTINYLCDRVVVLYLGKVMETASVVDIFTRPQHPYTQALLSAIPKAYPSEHKQRQILFGEIPSALHPPSGCPFRTRCPYAQPVCAEDPPKRVPKRGHEYWCILPPKGEQKG